jgi:hypothetical protein
MRSFSSCRGATHTHTDTCTHSQDTRIAARPSISLEGLLLSVQGWVNGAKAALRGCRLSETSTPTLVPTHTRTRTYTYIHTYTHTHTHTHLRQVEPLACHVQGLVGEALVHAVMRHVQEPHLRVRVRSCVRYVFVHP